MNFRILFGRKSLIYLFLSLGILFSGVSLFGQAVATLESQELLMGNRMKLNISVPVPSDTARVEFPLIQKATAEKRKYVELLNDTVELLTSFIHSIEKKGNKDWMNYELQLQAFDSGKYELPPFEFIVNGQRVVSNSVTLNVIPVKVKADDKIDGFSDIAEPFEINPNPEELEEESSLILWWLIAAAILVLAIIIYLYLRYKKTGSFNLLAKPLPPYAVALNKLKKLQQQNLPQKGKTKEYYTRLTDILRGYLNKQFRIKTFEKTSSEILQQMRDNDSVSEYEGVLKSIFETADFVKFAKVNPSVVENGRCLSDAERFVKASRPEEDVEKKKGGKQ